MDYFECDCKSRNHLIRIPKDDYEKLISLEFCIDYTNYKSYEKNFLVNLWNEIRWRFVNCIKILFVGKIKIYDEWLVDRSVAKKLAERLLRDNK